MQTAPCEPHELLTLTDITGLHNICPVQTVDTIYTVNAPLSGQHRMTGYPEEANPRKAFAVMA